MAPYDDLYDDPPDYDHEEAERGGEHAAAQRELAAIEAEEARDAAGEAWQEATYGPFNTGPGGA